MAQSLEIITVVEAYISSYMLLRRIPKIRLSNASNIYCVHFEHPVRGATKEYFVFNREVEEALKVISSHKFHSIYWLTIIGAIPRSTRIKLASEGYELELTEFLMARSLDSFLTSKSVGYVHQVKTVEEVNEINRFHGELALTFEQVENATVNAYYIRQDSKMAACGISLFPMPDIVYIGKLFTCPLYRRRGLASTLLATMLSTAVKNGVKHSILVSTQTGHNMYRKLGYEDLKLMQLFKANVQ